VYSFDLSCGTAERFSPWGGLRNASVHAGSENLPPFTFGFSARNVNQFSSVSTGFLRFSSVFLYFETKRRGNRVFQARNGLANKRLNLLYIPFFLNKLSEFATCGEWRLSFVAIQPSR
jgi:hypothetical protein